MPSNSLPGAAALPARARVSHALAAFALALLLGLQPVTTDVYLPALPMLKQALGAPMAGVQLTMSALILAFGLAQLFWGPVADRVGRRPVLLWGLGLYTLASIGAALAPNIEALVVWRVLQGACMAAAVVVARAIVRDLYEPHEGAQVMALALAGLGVIAITGPVAGGLVAAHLGWRATLGLVAMMGAGTLAFVVLRLPETLLRPNPQATALRPLLAAWGTVARHRSFQAWALLTACTYGGLYVTLAGSSFVYIGMLGLTPGQYGLAMASGSGSYLLGTLVCRRWIPQHGMVGTVARGAAFTLAAGLLLAGLALAGVHSLWAVLVPQWLYAFGHGMHQPCGQTGAVGPFPRHAGAASALAGLVLAVVAFGVGQWLGGALNGSVLPYALCIGLFSVLTATVAWTLVRHLPPVPRPA